MILMNNLDKVDFLYFKCDKIESFIDKKSHKPFSNDVIDYLDSLSKILIKDSIAKKYPDVLTFGFFCRKSNLLSLKKKYLQKDTLRIGRGVLFHIAPSNVPVNFAFSLLSGMISGNLNIVRVPSKKYEQIDIILNAFEKLSKINDYKFFAERTIIVRYEKAHDITNIFSSICDVRLIWGGDNTINEIRKINLNPKSFDITFPDRYSFCIINSDKYINDINKKNITSKFYNDTYLFDQNGCSSPHLIIWVGKNKNIKKSKILFWDNLNQYLNQKYKSESSFIINKLLSFYIQSVKLNDIKLEDSSNNLITRVNIKEPYKNIDQFKSYGGYFNEYNSKSLKEIDKIVNKKYQTLSYYGFSKNKLKSLIKLINPNGIDRVVPIGRTTEFSFTWDGFNLINVLSREIEVL